jgi:lipoprotein-anchoring transpeptidase ErfK/SrfK
MAAATPAVTVSAGAAETQTPVVSTPTEPAAPTATPTPTATTAATVAPSPTPTETPAVKASPRVTDVVAPTATLMPTRTNVPNYTPEQRMLVVDQDSQTMLVYENEVEIRRLPVSTGAPVANAFTPAWQGKVGPFWGKAAFRNTNLWADYIWYLFPGSEGSILIHSVPYTRSGEAKVYDNLEALGVRPASAGCVRISPEDAEWLAAWNPVGVPIEITQWSGEIAPVEDPS